MIRTWAREITLAATVFALMSCQQNSRDREIEAEIRGYYNALSARDWESFGSYFWPGATLATVWLPPRDSSRHLMVISVEEFIARAPEGPDSKPIFEEKPTAITLTASNDLAQAWVHYEARFGDPEDVSEWMGIDAFTLLLHEGRWKIVSISYSSAEDAAR